MWLSQLARMLTAFLSNTNHFIEVLSEETAQCAFSLAMLPPAIVNLVYVERLCHGARHLCSRLQSEGLLCLGPLSVRQTAPIWTHRTYGQGPYASLHTTDSESGPISQPLQCGGL